MVTLMGKTLTGVGPNIVARLSAGMHQVTAQSNVGTSNHPVCISTLGPLPIACGWKCFHGEVTGTIKAGPSSVGPEIMQSSKLSCVLYGGVSGHVFL